MNNNYFDLGSKKFLIITLVILACFFLLIVKAFNDLSDAQANMENNQPQKQAAVDINNVMNTMPRPNDSEEQNQEEQPAEQQYEPQRNRGLNVDIQSSVNATEELKPIDDNEALPAQAVEPVQENNQSLSAEQQLELQFLSARKNKDEKQYVKALEEYKAIAENSTDANVKARCYEEMADVYGIVKRYGTALSYAQRAYNAAPTTSREMLIARLYYKTGEIDKATKRVNNILQRDFSNDR